MKHYRIYKLKGPKGRITKGKDLHAENDAVAVAAAEADDDCPVCEVWQGTKKVGEVE